MKRFLVLLILLAAGCMTAGEKSTCEESEPVMVHDTVTVVKRDTLTITKRDTIRIHDTTKVILYDTLKVLANVTDPAELVGVWDGLSGTQKATLAFTEGAAYLEFSGIVAGVAVNGYFRTLDNGQAKVTHAGFKDVTWLLSLKAGVLIIEEIGVKVFAGQNAELMKR